LHARDKTNRTSVVLIYLIIAILAYGIAPSYSSTTTHLVAPIIIDKTLRTGSTFSINITVADAQGLFGYQFILSYNTSVLSAIDYGFYPPFVLPAPSEINDTAGRVSLAASSYMGDLNGVTTVSPMPIARIDFMVKAKGTSVLDLHDTVIANVYGEWIAHDVTDGFFANVKTKIPNMTPADAIPPRLPDSKLPRPNSSQDIYYAGVKLTETFVAKGVSGNVHVYKNRVIDPYYNISFHLALTRWNGTYWESLGVGFFQDIDYFCYAEWYYGKPGEIPFSIEANKSSTVALSNHFIEIVEVAPETFEARVDSRVLMTHTFTHVLGDREYVAEGESHWSTEPYNSLRGHFWGLKWMDSSGGWHPWQVAPPYNFDPYSVFFPHGTIANDDFYTLGGGILGDINGNGIVDVLDWSTLSAHWSGPPDGPLGYDSNADVTGGVDRSGQMVYGAPNGQVEMDDLSVVSAHWS